MLGIIPDLRSNDALSAQGILSEGDVDNTVISILTDSSIFSIAADRKAIETIQFLKVMKFANIKGCFLES